MNRRLVSVFLFAVVVASTASFVLYRVLLSQLIHTPAPVPTGQLLIASHNLEVGTLITAADLKQVSWTGNPPDDAVRVQRNAIGRGVVASIYRGEPISARRLATPGAGAGLAAIIPVGKRAVALKVDEVVGLAGFVVPGTHVDVVVSNSHSTDQDTSAKTVLQNIEVLSAGQHIARSIEGKPDDVQVVNLLVTPEQAELMSLVSAQTRVQLVLRNPLDTKEAASAGASLAKLFGAPLAPKPVALPPRPAVIPVVKPAPPAEVIEVYHGAKRTDESIQGGLN